ncbi:MAG: PaaI family thioesterase [Actinomycetota bacterium]
MARYRLTNDDWGIETNCFVCEPTNPVGLQLAFYADPERNEVDAEFQLGSSHSGAPAVVHGGVSLAVLDEVQAWAAIALAGHWAVTIETSATFHAAVWVDHPHRAVATVESVDGDIIRTSARILGADGELCVAAKARFQAVGEATARRFAGDAVLSGENRRFLRSDKAD